MPYGLLLFAIEIGFCVHVVRTGRPIFWIFIIIFAPLLGCAIYFFAEIFPELGNSRTVRKVATNLSQSVYSEREFQRLVERAEEVPTVGNLSALADAMAQRNDSASALALYERALVPPHENDASLLIGIARCQFHLGDPVGALATVDRLQAFNPGFRSHEGHLLYARSLEAAGRTDEALAEYAALAPKFPGEEARTRYAALLKENGRDAEAREIFLSVVRTTERGGRKYRGDNKEWYELARSNLR
jgi:hypothetical protein